MRHTRRIAAALVLTATAAFTAVGCGTEGGDQGGTGAGDDQQKVEPKDPTPPASEAGTPFEERAEAIEENWPDVAPTGSTGLEELQPVPAAEAAEDGAALTVTVGHGACDADWGVHVAESEDLVVLGGWREAGDAEACTEQLLTDEVTVELDERLGDRAVVDAATGESLVNPTLTK
ncbi:hypothetical protein WDH52_01065 [Streptomyces sp. TRM70308]|uniref:hypothetical protein n=1 Tax=Streptomyces TaxID=1883 RepID=UPI0022497706|nr:hypothetical protein [Streptomyces sp. JHD 1]MCX2969046.1 hypothetical protein [Streptomyces sp. JHD 1]